MADEHLPMAEEPANAVLSYGRASRRFWWRPLVAGLLLLIGCYQIFTRLNVQAGLQRRYAWYSLRHLRLPTGRLQFNQPLDAGKDAKAGMFAYEQVPKRWHVPEIQESIAAISQPPVDTFAWTPASLFVGAVRSPAGHERFLVVVVSPKNFEPDHVNGASFVCQLFTAGSLLHPAISEIPSTQPVQTAGGPVWWREAPGVWFDWGATVDFAAGQLDATDASVVRVPFWCNNQADEVLLRLHDDDTIDSRLASGGALPLRIETKTPYGPY